MKWGSYRARGAVRGLRMLLGLVLMVLATGNGLSQSESRDTQGTAQTQSGSVQLVLLPQTSQSRFRIELHNAGDQPLILNLGFVVSNGALQYPDAVRLLLTDSQGKPLHLTLSGPPLVAAPIGPMIVPLPAGATLAFPIDLKDYYARQERKRTSQLAPGKYTLSAEYIGAEPALVVPKDHSRSLGSVWSVFHYWIGTARSNTLPITLTEGTEEQHEP